MDIIKTYAVGNGEITLTEQDAEELRIILMTDYVERYIDERIDELHDELKFTSIHQRRRFVGELLRRNSDLVNFDLHQKETLDENIFLLAEEMNIGR